MKKIQSKVRVLELSQRYPSVFKIIKVNSIMGDGILTTFKLIQALIVVVLVCKNEEDPFKIESTRSVTRFLPLSVQGDLPDAQGHLTPQSKVRSGQILILSQNLWVSIFPARMKIQSVPGTWSNVVPGVVQHFSHYKSMEMFQDAQGQLTHK